MKDLGEVKFLLGIEIRKQPNGDIHLVQEKYLGENLQKFDMLDCRLDNTPLPSASKLSSEDSPQSDAERALMKDVPYGSILGSLIYLAACSHPDISAAISSLSH